MNYALAHQLETDGSIGIVMHIDPDDDPIANKNSNIYLDIKDKDNKFKIENCNCNFEIDERGVKVASGAFTSQVFSVIFPKKDIYQIVLTGQPLMANGFQNFKLTYNIRVDRSVEGGVNGQVSNSFPFFLPIILTTVLILGIVGFIVWKRKSK